MPPYGRTIREVRLEAGGPPLFLMIAHIDADAFFASVLQRKLPHLRGKPLLALGMGGGCVIAASYEAKAHGVKTGMRLSEAKKLVPNAMVEPSDFKEACIASREIESLLQNTCPVIERMSVDEWYLDLKSLPGGIPVNLHQWAHATCHMLKSKTHLSLSLGAGPSKLLAKMASEYRKPAGITVVSTQRLKDHLDIKSFLQDRPAAAIPGIGRRRAVHSEAHNWKTAWDIAMADEEQIFRLFGKSGRDMQHELRGIAIASVSDEVKLPKSISRCRSFPGTSDRSIMYSHLMHHLTYTIIKMRRHNLSCSMVALWMRDGSYVSHAKDAKIPQPASNEQQLLPYIEHCFSRLHSGGGTCTQIGLALMSLKPIGGTQYSLFEDPLQLHKNESIQTTLDTVHQRYGRGALTRGSALPTNQKSLKKQLYTIN